MGAATHAIRLKRRFGQSPCKTVNAVFERSENSVFDEENMLELVISHTTATDKWIRRHHYLHSTPAGAVIRMEFWIPVQETAELCSETELSGEKCLVGAMLWGRPVSPQIDQKHMGKALPDYEEIPIGLAMSDDVAREYEHIQKYFQALSRSDPQQASALQSAFINLLTAYPDQPYGHEPIFFSKKGMPPQVVYAPEDAVHPGCLQEKDQKVLELIRTKLDAGENVLVYTSWVRLDTQEKLFKALCENNIPAAVMAQRVPVERREEWIQSQLDEGIRVLIVNPTLLETGLDLNDFTTLIYYNISYNLFTLRQSSRRSWRINQYAPRIEVYFFYYIGSIQHRAIELMATKLSAATLIEGNISDEGLAALGSNDDLAAQLARELAQGISEHVEDLTAMFHKMAFLKENEQADEPTILDGPSQPGIALPSTVQPAGIVRHTSPVLPEGSKLRYTFTAPKTPRKKYGTNQRPEPSLQLSLFELFGQSA